MRKELVDNHRIPVDEIIVATGEERGLEKLDADYKLGIADPACPVKFVITQRALAEGWDCPFAYILVSMASLHSATAVEQLLGRVLRQPGASHRQAKALNQSYAFVVSISADTIRGRCSLACCGQRSQRLRIPSSRLRASRDYDGRFGHFDFRKHYYGRIGDFDGKEEFECACWLDVRAQQGHIELWVRNLVRREGCSFFLQKADGRFYPDFLCTLPSSGDQPGAILAVEYKGANNWTDAEDDRLIGGLSGQSIGGALPVRDGERQALGVDRGTAELNQPTVASPVSNRSYTQCIIA